jgi:hypothetical protein
MAKRSLVRRPEEERAHRLALTQRGQGAARPWSPAHILLQADAGGSDKARATALHRGMATVERLRHRGVEAGWTRHEANGRGPGATAHSRGRRKPS